MFQMREVWENGPVETCPHPRGKKPGKCKKIWKVCKKREIRQDVKRPGKCEKKLWKMIKHEKITLSQWRCKGVAYWPARGGTLCATLRPKEGTRQVFEYTPKKHTTRYLWKLLDRNILGASLGWCSTWRTGRLTDAMRQNTSESERQSRKKRFQKYRNTQIHQHTEIQKSWYFLQVVEEINLLKKFSNPHIIRFIEAFENPGEVILI